MLDTARKTVLKIGLLRVREVTYGKNIDILKSPDIKKKKIEKFPQKSGFGMYIPTNL